MNEKEAGDGPYKKFRQILLFKNNVYSSFKHYFVKFHLNFELYQRRT